MLYTIVLRHRDGGESVLRLERATPLRIRETLAVKGRSYVVDQALLGKDSENPRAWATESGEP